MKRHVLHPLWVAIGVVGLILLARLFMVPDDFGIHGDSFTYNLKSAKDYYGFFAMLSALGALGALATEQPGDQDERAADQGER